MKVAVIHVIIVLFLVSCSSKSELNDSKVKIELINAEVNYIDIDSNVLLNSDGLRFNELSGYSIDERSKACNVLTFKIINNSKKKYYFVIDDKKIDYYGNSTDFRNAHNNDSISIRRICFLLDSKKSENYEARYIFNGSNFDYDDDSLNIYQKKYSDIENNMVNFYGIRDQDNLSVDNTFVIYPGEYKIFKRKLYLPILLEKFNSHSLNYSSLIISPEHNFNFSLAIYSKKEYLWNSLPDYKRKEIIDNGYEIFDGVVVSNKVPLKLKK